jgi:hypothetical protein
MNILTWDIVQSKYSFSKSTTGAKSPPFRADPEENGSGARNPCWNHWFEWGTPSQGSRPYPWVGGGPRILRPDTCMHIMYIYVYNVFAEMHVCVCMYVYMIIYIYIYIYIYTHELR